MTDPSTTELPPELLRLSRGERYYAVPFYRKFILKYDTDRPQMHEDNERRVLMGAYATAARFWFMFIALFGVPAAFAISVSTSPAGPVLMTIAGLFFCVSLWRFFQALRFF